LPSGGALWLDVGAAQVRRDEAGGRANGVRPWVRIVASVNFQDDRARVACGCASGQRGWPPGGRGAGRPWPGRWPHDVGAMLTAGCGRSFRDDGARLAGGCAPGQRSWRAMAVVASGVGRGDGRMMSGRCRPRGATADGRTATAAWRRRHTPPRLPPRTRCPVSCRGRSGASESGWGA
jgi:hypothetical protein